MDSVTALNKLRTNYPGNLILTRISLNFYYTSSVGIGEMKLEDTSPAQFLTLSNTLDFI